MRHLLAQMINNKTLCAEGNLYTHDMTKKKTHLNAYLVFNVGYRLSNSNKFLVKKPKTSGQSSLGMKQRTKVPF